MPTVRSAGIACAVALGVYASWAGASVSGQSTAPFSDVTSQSGLDFVHVNGAEGGLLLPEVIGSGGALFDYDNDGDLDVFAVQGVRRSGSGSGAPGPDGRLSGSRLFRNDLTVKADGTRTLRFTDVTQASGIVAAGYGMGAATGDFDNDGWIDLYVTSLGPNQLFRNNGNGTFTDVTARSGTDDPRWSTSATFFDYDRDGWLDLFVANYVNFRPDMKRSCFSAGSARDYCNPVVYDPVPDKLLHNNRNGTFSDVSARSAIARESGRGLGVMASDFNGDGWTDLYVANDGDPNQLWINARGSGSFTDDALLAGVAVSRAGQPQGSMGIDIGDVDRDGDDDLFVTNLDNEGNTLYLNVGKRVVRGSHRGVRALQAWIHRVRHPVHGLRQRRLARSGRRQRRGQACEQSASERRSLSAEAAQPVVSQRPWAEVRRRVGQRRSTVRAAASRARSGHWRSRQRRGYRPRRVQQQRTCACAAE